MRELELSRVAWEAFAKQDPLWAILTDSDKSNRRWNTEDFFASGRKEISAVLHYLVSTGLPFRSENSIALDFGCGVGRLTQALAAHYRCVHGVDISETMIKEAERLNKFQASCFYHLNNSPDLALFASKTFDFVYTSIVLQHIPVRYIPRYLREIFRVLQPGGVAIFQIPDVRREDGISLWRMFRNKLRLRTRLRGLILYFRRAKSSQSPPIMEMNYMRENRVRRLIRQSSCRLVDIRLTNSIDPSFNGNLRFLDSAPEDGLVSKQYCVVKPT